MKQADGPSIQIEVIVSIDSEEVECWSSLLVRKERVSIILASQLSCRKIGNPPTNVPSEVFHGASDE